MVHYINAHPYCPRANSRKPFFACQLFCWSSCGAEYARRSAEEVGLVGCFVAFLPKPHVLLDDQHPVDWRRLLHVHPFQAGNSTAADYADALDRSENAADRLTSEALASLVIDSLVHPGIVRAEDVERAITIVTDELEARKAMGDY
ncbi:MAG: hypothetical protein ACOY0T_12750 [Myxococcota bacterium]